MSKLVGSNIRGSLPCTTSTARQNKAATTSPNVGRLSTFMACIRNTG